MPIFSGNSIVNLNNKISVKLEYSAGITIRALSHYKIDRIGLLRLWIWMALKRWIGIRVNISKIATYIIQVSEFLYRAVIANTFLSMNSILLVIGKIFIIL